MDGTILEKLCGLGMGRDALGSGGIVAQNCLILPGNLQTSDVAVMETLKHLDMVASRGHACSYGGSGRDRA